MTLIFLVGHRAKNCFQFFTCGLRENALVCHFLTIVPSENSNDSDQSNQNIQVTPETQVKKVQTFEIEKLVKEKGYRLVNLD